MKRHSRVVFTMTILEVVHYNYLCVRISLSLCVFVCVFIVSHMSLIHECFQELFHGICKNSNCTQWQIFQVLGWWLPVATKNGKLPSGFYF